MELSTTETMKYKFLQRSYGEMTFDECLSLLEYTDNILEDLGTFDPARKKFMDDCAKLREFLYYRNIAEKMGRPELLFIVSGLVSWNSGDLIEFKYLTRFSMFSGTLELKNLESDIRVQTYLATNHNNGKRCGFRPDSIVEILITDFHSATKEEVVEFQNN